MRDKQLLSRDKLGNSGTLGIELTPYEYVGALSDFTGELGRVAVNMASKRAMEGVLEVQEVVTGIVRAMSVNSLGEKFGQKFKAMNMNLQKIEDLVYELSMMQKSGRTWSRESEPENASVGGGAGDKNDDDDM
jgi:predicted translin family RNA/ssDNA-binding protein